jgi:hypothetical protein
VDADLNPDFAVVADANDTGAEDSGRVYIYSGPTATLLYTFDGTYKDQHLGWLPTRAPIDFNADGYDDVLVGSLYSPSYGKYDSSVFVYSGRTGRLLYELRGLQSPAGASEALGGSLSAIGDLNQDGIDDVIVGAPDNFEEYGSAGRVYVFGGNDLFLQADKEQYTRKDPITISIRGGDTGALALLALIDVTGTPVLVPLALGSLDANSELDFSSTVPSGLREETFTFMAWATRTYRKGVSDSIPETISIY